MRDEAAVENVTLLKSIDNSGIVREVDPKTSRDLVALLLLAAILVVSLGLYAWPHFQMRQLATQTEQMQRERDRLVEENRKLRLEKASLENLARVQAIAEKLGLEKPSPDQVVIVETPDVPNPDTRLASDKQASPEARN